MTKKTARINKNHGDEPFGRLERVVDVLPSPSDLVPKVEAVKITISIDSDTVNFFKQAAKVNKVKYQRMMREVLRGYARKFA